MMTATEALERGKAAEAANRPLTLEEEKAIGHHTHAPETDKYIRGGLKVLVAGLERQSDARVREQMARQHEEGLREAGARTQRRMEEWGAMPALYRALIRWGRQDLVQLIREEEAAPGSPPHNWKPAVEGF